MRKTKKIINFAFTEEIEEMQNLTRNHVQITINPGTKYFEKKKIKNDIQNKCKLPFECHIKEKRMQPEEYKLIIDKQKQNVIILGIQDENEITQCIITCKKIIRKTKRTCRNHYKFFLF